MKIQMLHASQPDTHKLLRPALERVMEFNKTYDSESDPDIMFAELSSAYFQQTPALVMWVGLDDDDDTKIVGHLVASADNYFGGRFVTIHQCWKDPEVKDFTFEDKQTLIKIIGEFGRAYDCEFIRTFAINSKVAAILQGYGFHKSERTIMEIQIPKTEEPPKVVPGPPVPVEIEEPKE